MAQPPSALVFCDPCDRPALGAALEGFTLKIVTSVTPDSYARQFADQPYDMVVTTLR